ncbi:MAG: response regulator [Bacteroidetes bacterium]|nr:response regulator [Bacteroidota bacterium]MBK7041002.1 response regulator [Bacteroidota bacterium]MBK7587835.1 response regulator [Bacteroidota bacterium]MBK8328913.1 response regulator [Bacteroidota bacterium]MBK9302234.1 response regulator [Bacteroidota bacterium]
MKTIIVDDERLARNELRKILKEFPEIEVIEEAVNAEDAQEKIELLQPELIFLDIQMPGGKTGFDLLEQLEYTPKVLFTTAYSEFAIKAFEYNALDYLLKPIDKKRLHDAVQKVKKQLEKDTQSQKHKLGNDDQVFVKDGERCWFVKLSEVRLFESVGNYAKVFFGNNKPLILKSLNALEERLDDKIFFRANRKHIINLQMIQKMDTHFNGGLKVTLNAGEEIEISRRQAVKFKDNMSL